MSARGNGETGGFASCLWNSCQPNVKHLKVIFDGNVPIKYFIEYFVFLHDLRAPSGEVTVGLEQ